MAETRAPQPGDVETKFGRRYSLINPDPNLGPGTWRLSMPEEYTGGGSGGGSGVADIDGIPPIVADQRASGTTEISMDITQLDPR